MCSVILHRTYTIREVNQALMLIHELLIANALRAVHIIGDETTSTQLDETTSMLFTTTLTSSAGPGRAL